MSRRPKTLHRFTPLQLGALHQLYLCRGDGHGMSTSDLGDEAPINADPFDGLNLRGLEGRGLIARSPTQRGNDADAEWVITAAGEAALLRAAAVVQDSLEAGSDRYDWEWGWLVQEIPDADLAPYRKPPPPPPKPRRRTSTRPRRSSRGRRRRGRERSPAGCGCLTAIVVLVLLMVFSAMER